MPKRKDITAAQRSRRWHAGVAAINAATKAEDIPDILAVWGKKLDLDMEGYNSLVDTSLVDEAIFGGIGAGGYADRQALASVATPVISQAVTFERILQLVNNVNAPARFPDLLPMIEDWMSALGVDVDMEAFNMLPEGAPTAEDPPAEATGKWAVYEAFYEGIPYASAGELLLAFEDAVENEYVNQAVRAVNAATSTQEMLSVLLAYACILRLAIGEESNFDGLTPENKELVLETMLAGQPYEDAAAIKTTFEAKAMELAE